MYHKISQVGLAIFSSIKFFFVFLLVAVPVSAYAQESAVENKQQLDFNLLLTSFDAGGNDDFHSGQAVSVQYSYFFKNWLAADVGLMSTAKTLDQNGVDVVGDFRASIQSSSILFGLKARRKFTSPYEIYSRFGLLYWSTELEVEEYFDENVPGGKVSATDNGTGYYIGIGGAHYITDNVSVQLEVLHMKQLDVFEGETNFPFDLAITAFSLGIGYRF